MKALRYFLPIVLAVTALASCEKKDYPPGVEELAHHYYCIFVPNNNSAVTVSRSQTALVKFPVQFYSIYEREYDAVARYAVVTGGISSPAQLGVDFNVVDKDGNVIPTTDSTFSIVFPHAVKKTDTIYLKMLNNPAAGARKFEIQIQENTTSQYYVDIFSTAYRRPVTIN